MKIKELLQELQKHNPEMEVMLKTTDPSDWEYYNDPHSIDVKHFETLEGFDECSGEVLVIDMGVN